MERGAPQELKEQPKFSAFLRFDTPGHEGEYTLNLEGYNIERFIPNSIDFELKKELGTDWEVSNRGTRIEIFNRKKFGHQDDTKVQGAVKKVLDPHGFQMK